MHQAFVSNRSIFLINIVFPISRKENWLKGSNNNSILVKDYEIDLYIEHTQISCAQ